MPSVVPGAEVAQNDGERDPWPWPWPAPVPVPIPPSGASGPTPTRPAPRALRALAGLRSLYVAAAAALVYFATIRLTRGMAASVCFLAMGRILS